MLLAKKCLNIIYDDKQSSFKELFEKVSSVTIYEKMHTNSGY